MCRLFYNQIYSTVVSICIADKIQPIVKHGKNRYGLIVYYKTTYGNGLGLEATMTPVVVPATQISMALGAARPPGTNMAPGDLLDPGQWQSPQW